MDSTIVDEELDADSRYFVENIANPDREYGPDLDVDGLSDTLTTRFRRLFDFGLSE